MFSAKTKKKQNNFVNSMKKGIKFILIQKSEGNKNKYGMMPQNYNRRTNVAMEHNGLYIGAVGDLELSTSNLPLHFIRCRMFDLPLNPLLLPIYCYSQ